MSFGIGSSYGGGAYGRTEWSHGEKNCRALGSDTYGGLDSWSLYETSNSPSSSDRMKTAYDQAREWRDSNTNASNTHEMVRTTFQETQEINNESRSNSEIISRDSIQTFNASITKLSQTTQPFNLSILRLTKTTLSLEQEVYSFKQEREKLHKLLENNRDKIKVALDKKQEAKETLPTVSDCSWKGYFNAGLAKIADDMIEKNASSMLVSQVCIQIVLNQLKQGFSIKNLDAVGDDINDQINSFAEGWIEHRRHCLKKL